MYSRYRYLDVSVEPLTTPQPQELEQSPVVVITSRRFNCSSFIFFLLHSLAVQSDNALGTYIYITQ